MPDKEMMGAKQEKKGVKGFNLITTKMAQLYRHTSHSSPPSELGNAFNRC